jgi:hypothetical protein
MVIDPLPLKQTALHVVVALVGSAQPIPTHRPTQRIFRRLGEATPSAAAVVGPPAVQSLDGRDPIHR